MNAGEIGTEAGRIFGYNLPSNWILRSQEDQNDHGIDCEIEVKDEKGIAKGNEFIFKVQIKGEEQSKYINNKSLLSYNLKTSRLKYYLTFNIPVILVVVEVSSEKIFWLSITDNEELIEKSKNIQTDSIQIHIPTKNTFKRKDKSSANSLLKSTIDAWDYLAVQGIRKSVSRFHILESDKLEKRIEIMGDALYKAQHQMLGNHLFNGEFIKVYEISGNMIKSVIIPTADRFVAALFYRTTLSLSPLHKTAAEQAYDLFCISNILINLAREQRAINLRLYSIGLARSAKLKFEIKHLSSTHHANKAFEKSSLEGIIFNSETYDLYSRSCINLQKLIDLLYRTAQEFQFHIFSEIFFESAYSLLVFRTLQKERGTTESIESYQSWLVTTLGFCLTYYAIANDSPKLEQIYSMALHAELLTSDDKNQIKLNISKIAISALETIQAIERDHKPFVHRDFLEISTEEQKQYFTETAKNLGMDPDDKNCMYGQIVSIGLKNYDPSEIISNCEHLFVDYRPGGIIAQTLQMHSAGGMHLLICLKHNFASGTGNLLNSLYDSPGTPWPGFKQAHCDKCTDCNPRPPQWKWSLAWHQNETTKHKKLLNKFKF